MGTRGTYIIIGAAAGYISGAPIYYLNKASYQERNGWNVYFISCRSGKLYIEGLRKYIIATVPSLTRPVYLLPRKEVKKTIDDIILRIPKIEGEIVIESGTDYTSYWGEFLAKRLKAKHVVILLDEYNDRITKEFSVFYKYKFFRRELACISSIAMIGIFGKFWEITKENAIALPCDCTNSMTLEPSSLSSKIVRCKYNIGYIGRLEKNMVCHLLESIKFFANENPEDSILFVCFGGSSSIVEKNIVKYLSSCPNVTVYISGFIYPIPYDALKKCDIFVSTAGSAIVSFKAGIPTVFVDQYKNIPLGFINKIGIYNSCPNCDNIVDYLRRFFRDKYVPEMVKYDITQEQIKVDSAMHKHNEFIKSSSKRKCYFKFSQFRPPITRRLKNKLVNVLIKILKISQTHVFLVIL